MSQLDEYIIISRNQITRIKGKPQAKNHETVEEKLKSTLVCQLLDFLDNNCREDYITRLIKSESTYKPKYKELILTLVNLYNELDSHVSRINTSVVNSSIKINQITAEIKNNIKIIKGLKKRKSFMASKADKVETDIDNLTQTLDSVVRKDKEREQELAEKERAAAVEKERAAAVEQKRAAAVEKERAAAVEQKRAAAVEEKRVAENERFIELLAPPHKQKDKTDNRLYSILNGIKINQPPIMGWQILHNQTRRLKAFIECITTLPTYDDFFAQQMLKTEQLTVAEYKDQQQWNVYCDYIQQMSELFSKKDKPAENFVCFVRRKQMKGTLESNVYRILDIGTLTRDHEIRIENSLAALKDTDPTKSHAIHELIISQLNLIGIYETGYVNKVVECLESFNTFRFTYPQDSVIIKTIRANGPFGPASNWGGRDCFNDWLEGVTKSKKTMNSEEANIPLRVPEKKPWTSTSSCGVQERKLVGAEWKKVTPQFTPAQKEGFSKKQSATVVDPRKPPDTLFGSTRSGQTIFVGIVVEPKDILISHAISYDGGTFGRHNDAQTREGARYIYDKKVYRGIFHANIYSLLNSGNENTFNEILARMKWNTDGTSKIIILDDNIESRITAIYRAQTTLTRLRQQHQENGDKLREDYSPPICFYSKKRDQENNDFPSYEAADQLQDLESTLQTCIEECDEYLSGRETSEDLQFKLIMTLVQYYKATQHNQTTQDSLQERLNRLSSLVIMGSYGDGWGWGKKLCNYDKLDLYLFILTTPSPKYAYPKPLPHSLIYMMHFLAQLSKIPHKSCDKAVASATVDFKRIYRELSTTQYQNIYFKKVHKKLSWLSCQDLSQFEKIYNLLSTNAHKISYLVCCSSDFTSTSDPDIKLCLSLLVKELQVISDENNLKLVKSAELSNDKITSCVNEAMQAIYYLFLNHKKDKTSVIKNLYASLNKVKSMEISAAFSNAKEQICQVLNLYQRRDSLWAPWELLASRLGHHYVGECTQLKKDINGAHSILGVRYLLTKQKEAIRSNQPTGGFHTAVNVAHRLAEQYIIESSPVQNLRDPPVTVCG